MTRRSYGARLSGNKHASADPVRPFAGHPTWLPFHGPRHPGFVDDSATCAAISGWHIAGRPVFVIVRGALNAAR